VLTITVDFGGCLFATATACLADRMRSASCRCLISIAWYSLLQLLACLAPSFFLLVFCSGIARHRAWERMAVRAPPSLATETLAWGGGGGGGGGGWGARAASWVR